MVYWLDVESQAAVELFWKNLGSYENTLPRPIEQLVEIALPISLVRLPKLDLDGIAAWFVRHTVSLNLNYPNRRLHGCLVAYHGTGFIFVDSLDSEAERRFTIAHEAAHFILDYLNPRTKAVNMLGDSIVAVLTGKRLPTAAEILAAAIQRIPIDLTVKLMERNEQLGFVLQDVQGIEDRADRLALALLAPPETVLAEIRLNAPKFVQRHDELTAHLRRKYSLPNGLARQYSYALLVNNGHGPAWVERLDLR